jgi:chromosome segregation ATPase
VTLETETGFGTGLRSSIERKQAISDAPETTPLAREVAAVAASIEDAWAAEAAAFGPLELVTSDTGGDELEALKAELQEALGEVESLRERERDLRAETAEQTRTQSQLQLDLEQRAAAIAEREQSLLDRVKELEREQSQLVERHTEIVAEYARVTELGTHVDGRVEELEQAEAERARAAGEIAKQLATVGERERELKRERVALEANQQAAEARVAAREHAVRERDDTLAQRERAVHELEAHTAGELARVEAREESLAAAESRLADHTKLLAAVESELEKKTADLALATENAEVSLSAWEERLRVQEERLDRERQGHGQASQDAFALLAELEAREAGVVRRESELLAAQSRLQADAAGADAVAGRARELDVREIALKALEDDLEARAAYLATSDLAGAAIDELRAELARREQEVDSHEQLQAERRERLEKREERLAKLEQDLKDRATHAEKLDEELRLREARAEAGAEIREDKLDALARELSAREERIARREHDLAGYVGELQEKFRERDTDWWTKQLGRAPSPLS